MKVCQHCGQVIADDANFCPKCGKSQNASNSYPVKKVCAWCEGKGTVKGFLGGQITCEVCHGTTRNVFTGPVDLCTRCSGSGIDPEERSAFNERIRCPVCKGKGWIS